MNKSVLFISYIFPPAGGAGVQRATKFVKYLPEFGWTPTVLTVENPSVPLFDESLVKEIPDEVTVIRAKTYEPGYKTKQAVSSSTLNHSQSSGILRGIKWLLRKLANLLLQPDSQILWFPQAAKSANRSLKEKRVDAIIATAPPFSSLVLGAFLARKHQIPLILDYRDEWEISNQVWENKSLGVFSRMIQGKMQKYAVMQASAILATTVMSKDSINEIIVDLGARAKTHCIYNGYDAKDFIDKGNTVEKPSSKYKLSYVGTLWGLTSIAPIVEAALRLESEYPELAKVLEIVVAGRRVAEQDKILQRLKGSGVGLVVHDYLSHDDALQLMLESQGLCLLLSDIGVAQRVVPAKVFEYMATRNSIVVVAPKGEVWDILSDYPGAVFSEPNDLAGLTKILADDISRFLKEGNVKVAGFNSERFERRHLTSQLAHVLDTMVESAHG